MLRGRHGNLRSVKAQKKLPLQRATVAPAPVPVARSRRWWYAAGLAILCYVGFQAYGSVINGPFVFDDRSLPFFAPDFPNELRLWITGVRPLLMLSYWINFQISQTQTLWYHIFNVLLHCANSFLVFLSVRKILTYPQARVSGSDGQMSLLLSAFAAGVFLLHPVQTESVAYIAGRSESLSLLFVLGAFTLFLYRRTDAVSWRVAMGVLLLYVAAVSVKEHAVALIAVLLLTDFFWNPGFSLAGIRKNWRLYVPAAAGAGLGTIFVWRVLSCATTAGFNIKEFTWYQYFFTQCRAFFLYLRLVFFPLDQNADYQFPISRTILDHGALYGLIGILLLAGFALYTRERYRLASYGFFVYLALLAPTSSFVPIQDPVAERRLYMPIIGMLFIVTDLLQRLPVRRKLLAGAMAGVLLMAGTLAHERNRVWTSDVALWQDTVQKSPQNPRAHFQLAYAYQYEANQCDQALREYATVDRIAGPAYDKRYGLLVDWGEAYDCLNQPEAALAKLRQAAALEPGAQVYMEIGVVAAKHNRIGEALDAVRTAQKLDPNYAKMFVKRGKLFEKMQQFLPAIESFRAKPSADHAELPAGGFLHY